MILCLAAFIALVPGVQGKLNHLQWRWGKAILGCRYQRELRHHLVVAQCGWDMRLGTCLLLELVMTRARIVLLPEDHPAARLAACLQTAPCVSWFTQVKALLQEASLHCTLPTLSGCDFFTCQDISAARSDAFLRKKILRRYRQEVVRPMLLEYDRRHLAECLSFDIPVFGCSLATLGFYTLNLDWEIFHLKTPNVMWFNFRAWCLVRITARWPLPLFGCKELPLYLTCPACGEPEASYRASAVPVCGHNRSLCNFLQQGSWLPEQVTEHSLLSHFVWHASNVAGSSELRGHVPPTGFFLTAALCKHPVASERPEP